MGAENARASWTIWSYSTQYDNPTSVDKLKPNTIAIVENKRGERETTQLTDFHARDDIEIQLDLTEVEPVTRILGHDLSGYPIYGTKYRIIEKTKKSTL